MEHPDDKTHLFYSPTQSVVRGWVTALMKSTIERDYGSEFNQSTTRGVDAN